MLWNYDKPKKKEKKRKMRRVMYQGRTRSREMAGNEGHAHHAKCRVTNQLIIDK